MKTDQIVRQLDALRSRYQKALKAFDGLSERLPTSKRKELLTSSQAAVERLSPSGSFYLTHANELQDANEDFRLESLMGIVEALRHDYADGGLAPIQELIRAEVFDDFLEMSEHLLEQGYKDPAAVLVGSVLEQHLRKLCDRASISTLSSDGKPKKADLLNSELAARSVYGKLDQKSVVSWLGLRNDAAHGHYDKYSSEQVCILLLGVRDFMHRTRA
jgi:hypothetical protein